MLKKLAFGLVSLAAAPLALAQVQLGVIPRLPFVEGGLLTVGVVGLVIGIRLVRNRTRKSK